MDETEKQPIRVDRRRHARFELSLPLSYQWGFLKDTLRTFDVSLGGIRIQTETPIPVDETLDLIILLQNEAITPVGRVIWSEMKSNWTYDAGICFENISDQCLERLERFLHGIITEGNTSRREKSVDRSFTEALESRPYDLNRLTGNFLKWLSRSYPGDYRRYAGRTEIGVHEIQTFLKSKGIDTLNIYYLVKAFKGG